MVEEIDSDIEIINVSEDFIYEEPKSKTPAELEIELRKRQIELVEKQNEFLMAQKELEHARKQEEEKELQKKREAGKKELTKKKLAEAKQAVAVRKEEEQKKTSTVTLPPPLAALIQSVTPAKPAPPPPVQVLPMVPVNAATDYADYRPPADASAEAAKYWPLQPPQPAPTVYKQEYTTSKEAKRLKLAKKRNERRKKTKAALRQNLKEKIAQSTAARPLLAEALALKCSQASTGSVSALVEKMDISGPGTVYPINPTPANVLQDDEEPDEFDSIQLPEEDGVEKPHYVKTKVKTSENWFVQDTSMGRSEIPKPQKKDVYNFEAPPTRLRKNIIQDKWMLLERELMLADIFRDNPTRNMPSTSVQEVAHLVKSTKRYHGKNLAGFSKFIDSRPDDLPDSVRDFIRTVETTRVMSVNTEGQKFKLPNGKPRVMITLGSSDGRVLFFNRHDILPKKLIHFMEDPAYTKIGSGLENEFEELSRVNLTIRNWVEIGCCRVALYPLSWEYHKQTVQEYRDKNNFNHIDIEVGIPVMVKDLVKAKYFPDTYRRKKYNHDWECYRGRVNHQYTQMGRPPPDMEPHMLENARVPFAELVLIVETFAKRRGYDLATEPFWPIAYEALDLCRLRDPKSFQKSIRWDQTKDYWMFHVDSGDDHSKAVVPATCHEMMDFYRARVDLRETYFNVILEKAANEVYKRFWPEGENKIAFVKYDQIGMFPPEELLRLRCASCGHEGHQLKDCPIEKNPTCQYPHDGITYDAHSTLCCPHLHLYCEHCQMIGHDKHIHWTPEIMMTFREIRKRFFAFMHKGLFTSIPLLTLHKEGREKIKALHWKYALDNRRFHQAVIGRFALGVTTNLVTQRNESDMTQFRLQKDYQLEVIRKNTQKSDGRFYKLPRNLAERFNFQKADIEALKDEAAREMEQMLEETRQNMKRGINEFNEMHDKAKKFKIVPNPAQSGPSGNN